MIASGSLLDALRASTGPAHRRLEADLALLDGPPSAERFGRVLEGFRCFHAAWEPVAAAALADPTFFEPRRRLGLIDADLRALGRASAGRSPGEDWARRVDADHPAGVWGSVYVVEGSALGGKIIARALAGAPWLPPGGLRTFDPYGADAGRRWAECRARLTALPADARPRVVAAAEAAFAALHALLAPERRAAA